MMKRIIALLLSISIMFTTCAPTALAVGDELADSTQQETVLRPEVPQTEETDAEAETPPEAPEETLPQTEEGQVETLENTESGVILPDEEEGAGGDSDNTETKTETTPPEEETETQDVIASGICGENATWELVGNTLTISGTGYADAWQEYNPPWMDYLDTIDHVIIENGITGIGTSAYLSVLTAYLPEGLVWIGPDAFAGFRGTEIQFPSTLEIIDESAFWGSTSLQTFNIPEKVSFLDATSLGHGESLKTINVDENNRTYKSVDGIVFSKDGTWLIAVPQAKEITKYTVPDGTEVIRYNAFAYNNLQEIVIPLGVTIINDLAFRRCDNIEKVSLPATIVEIGSRAFRDCTALTEISFDGTAEQWEAVLAVTESDNDPLVNATVYLADGTIYEGGEAEKTSYPVTFIMGDDQITVEFYADQPLSTGGVGGSTAPTGADIQGWYTDSDCTIPWDMENDLVTGPLTLYAKMAEGYTWSYDADTQTLTISGTGEVQLEDFSTDNTPWRAYIYDIEHIVIEEGITDLGDLLFFNHTAAKTVSLPSTLKSIGKETFWNCSRLEKIEIPASVEEFGPYPFALCGAEITVDENNPCFEVKNGAIFTKKENVIYAENMLVMVLPTTSGEYAVPAGTGMIEDDAFAYNEYITKVKIPQSVWALSSNVFSNMPLLEEVVCLAEIDRLYYSTFNNCWNLKKVVLPATITRIDNFVFDNSHEDLTIYFMGTEEQWNDIQIGSSNTGLDAAEIVFGYEYSEPAEGELTGSINWALADGVLTVSGTGDMPDFEWIENDYVDGNILLTDAPWLSYRMNIRKVVIGEGITRLGAHSFAGYENITEITLPEGLDSIGALAMECVNVTELNLPSTLTTIEDYGLKGLWNVETLHIPASVTYIGANALSYMQSLSEFTVDEDNSRYVSEDGVIYTNGYSELVAFPGYGKTEYVVNGNVLNIADGAFWGSDIEKITLDEELETIGNYAFAACDGLTEIVIPSRVTAIGDSAFVSCENLETVTLPANLSSIGENAFFRCLSLGTVYFRGSEEEWTDITIGEGNERLTDADIVFDYYIYEGQCGENAYWTYNASTKELVIHGSGAMDDYEDYSDQPWYEFSNEDIRSVVIEEGITHLGSYTLADFNECEAVSLPSTLKSIGSEVFVDWASYEGGIDIPDSVTEFGTEVFRYTYLDYLNIPRAMTTISDNCFDSMGSLRVLYVPKTVKAYGGSVFDMDTAVQFIVYEGNYDEYQNITVKEDNDGLEKICVLLNNQSTMEGELTDTVNYCYDLDTATLTITGTGPMPNFDYSTDQGGDYIAPAPWYGLDINKAVIGSGVESIGEYTFNDISISTLVINKSVTEISDYAFGESGSVYEVYYTGTEEQWNAITVGTGNTWINNAEIYFDYIPVLSGTVDGLDWIVEDGALLIEGEGEFAPENLPWAGQGATIANVTFGEGITAADVSFIDGTDGMVLYLPSTMEEITMGDAEATQLEIWYEGTLEDWLNVAKTNNGAEGLKTAVVYCLDTVSTQATDWTFVTMFGLDAYFTVEGDTAVIAGKGVAGTGEITSTWDENIRHVVITGAISELAESAFFYYTDIETMTVEAPVKVYGSCSLGWMENLTELTLPATATKMGDAVFKGSSKLKEIVVPKGVTHLGYGMFMFCESLEKVYIPATVKTHSGDLFTMTPNLQDVFFAGTEKQWNAIKFNDPDCLECDWCFMTEPEIHFNAKMGINSVTVRNAEDEEITALNINVYEDTVETLVKAELNAIGEYEEGITVSTDSDYVATVTETDVPGEYLIYTNGGGTAKVTFASAANPKVKTVVTVKATQMAHAAEISIGKLVHPSDKYIMIKDQVVKPTIKWLGGAAWPEYWFEIRENCTVADLPDDYTVRALEAGETLVTLVAQGEDGRQMETDIGLAVYSEKTEKINLNTNTLVIDPGYLTPRDMTAMLWAEPSNDACPDYAITVTQSPVIISEEAGLNAVHFAALSNDKAKVTVTFKALDGSGKTAKATVQTGIAVRNVSLTLPENSYEQTVAVGRTIKATATVSPSTATVKKLNWYVEDEYDMDGNAADIVSVSNGTVKGIAPGTAKVWVRATDGSDMADYFEVTVTEKPANKVVLAGGTKTITIPFHDGEPSVFAPRIEVLGKDGTTDGVCQDVKITVGGRNAKYVNVWFDDTWNEGAGAWRFDAERAGKYTITAAAKDGSGKKATMTVNVQQHVFDIRALPPANTPTLGENYWIVQSGKTITPKVVYNWGEKIFAPAVKGYTIEAYNEEAQAAIDNGTLKLNAKKTAVTGFVTGTEPQTFALKLVSDCGCGDRQPAEFTLYLQVMPKGSVDMTNLGIDCAVGYDNENTNTVYLRKGLKAQFNIFANGIKVTSGVTQEWRVTDENGNDCTSFISQKGLLNLANAEEGKTYTVECIVTDVVSGNSGTAIKQVEVTRKIAKTEIGLVDENGTNLAERTDILPTTDYVDAFVPGIAGGVAVFSFKSSNAKIIEVDTAARGREIRLVPKGTGTATITVTAQDGSNVSATFKVKVNPQAVPVKAIVPQTKTITIGRGQPAAFDFALTTAKGDAPSHCEVEWTSSDPDLMRFGQYGDETQLTTGEKDTVYLNPQGKAGKVTITGTALDGSKKTVKVTVNLVEENTTDVIWDMDLSTPANTPNDGVDGQAVLTWGKSMQLKATYHPAKSKNVTLVWTVEGYDEENDEFFENPAGVTVKNGKVTVAKSTATFTPYHGYLRVTARTAVKYINEFDEFLPVYAEQMLYIKAPVASVKIENAPKTMYIGQSIHLAAYLELALNAPIDAYPVMWSVNDSKLAEIDYAGRLTIKEDAPAGKSVKVTAQAADGSGKKATATIKIAKYVPAVTLVCADLERETDMTCHPAMMEMADEGKIEYSTIEFGSLGISVNEGLAAAAEEADIVICKNMARDTAQWLEENAGDYPDTTFIITADNSAYVENIPNVQLMGWKFNEAAFLAGALAAVKSESGVIGFAGGPGEPAVKNALVGYIEGAKFADPDIKVIVSETANWTDADAAETLARAAIEQGADVLYAFADTAGLGYMKAAAEAGCLVIGTEYDHYEAFAEDDPEFAEHIVTSVLRDERAAMRWLIRSMASFNYEWEQYKLIGVAEGCQGIARSGTYWNEVEEDLDLALHELERMMMDGELEVSSAYSMTAEEIEALIASVQ